MLECFWKTCLKTKTSFNFPFYAHISGEMIRVDSTECASYFLYCIAKSKFSSCMDFICDEHMEYYDMFNRLKQKCKCTRKLCCTFDVQHSNTQTQHSSVYSICARFIMFVMLNVEYDFSLVLPQILLHILFLTSVFIYSNA